ncbi:DUF3048 domain-containing protein [Niallia nealsonii]|uniref:DUF3048 domain-containing protein n=1 Tax=Niallia nealsonii TaxID=115979 RepID=A0A2N0Z6P5_9BACI|nr:DUF3048 domain-containing protein [Niallia nealsonii]PKG25164.1 DUF3048 domain-containing protein [Niallia nealsonii]
MKKSIIFLFMTVLLTACSDDPKKVNGNNENQQSSNISNEQQESEELAYTYPLTGLKSKKESSNRAIGVMINNHPAARPQSGLSQADIVYEVLAEGDITRFLAIFQSEKPKLIGPVRSSRDYYIELAKGYDTLYIAHGYSPEAKKLLTNGYINNLNGMQYDGTLFKRASYRVAPHNSYISYSNILKGAEQKQYRLNKSPDNLLFIKKADLDKIAGEESSAVSVKFSSDATYNSQFKYNSDSQKYLRYSNGEQTVEYETKSPVAVDNVFILEAKHSIVDKKGRREVDLTSGGKGYLLQKGKWREVEWKNINGRILPFDNNKQAGLVPGKTWIDIIPSNLGLNAAVSFETR